MKTLIIINDPPYGTERMYNALRLAGGLVKVENHQITVFLMGDAVSGAMAGQKTPDGYYNVERMLRRIVNGQGEVLLCGTCLDARAIAEGEPRRLTPSASAKDCRSASGSLSARLSRART